MALACGAGKEYKGDVEDALKGMRRCVGPKALCDKGTKSQVKRKGEMKNI